MMRFTLNVFLGWLSVAAAAEPAAPLPTLKTGDVVLQATTGGQAAAITLASGSVYTHMGLVEIGADGKPMVVEAIGPVRVVTLDKWIAKGAGGAVTIVRMKGLEEETARKALTRARHYLGRPYDRYFYDDRSEIYCSELVYAAFKEGADISVGKVEKVRDLNIDNSVTQEVIRTRWKAHPLCKSKGAKSFSACYKLILDQTLVTPASIARDPQFEQIYSSFPAGTQ
jgi:hypothetical protein